jgi:hypothetical protein
MADNDGDFGQEIGRWLAVASRYDWPAHARPHVDGDALMVPEIYERDGLEVVEWARVRTREELLRALGMGPLFD